jgi:hypothetical protein
MAHRSRFKTMFAKVDDSLKARRVTKMMQRPVKEWTEADETDEDFDAESVQTAASNREREDDGVKAARDKAIDDWTFDPTDEAKRAAAVDAFQRRLEGKLDDAAAED